MASNNRWPVVAAFLAGALVALSCVVSYGPTRTAVPTLAEKKDMLKAAVQNMQRMNTQKLFDSQWAAVQVTDSPTAEGNNGADWNYGANFGGSNANAVARGWTSGADTVHDGGTSLQDL